jgi:Tfp pilus assembly protein PilE
MRSASEHPSNLTPPRGDEGVSRLAVLVTVAVVVATVVIVAVALAIVGPSVRNARVSGNETSAIATLRTIYSSQVAFQASCGNGAYAASLAALGKPAAQGQDGYLAADLAVDPISQTGYTIAFTPGPAAADAHACNGVAVVQSYFVLASPTAPGTYGRQYFAINPDGVLYSAPAPIAVTLHGAPPAAGPVLR